MARTVYMTLPQRIISGVILGLRMPEQQQDHVWKLVTSCAPDVAIYQAEMREAAYGLNICGL